VSYYTYDHVGRRLKYLYSLNGNLKTIASYKYDAIGRMTKKLYAPSDAVESNQTGLWTNLNTWQGGSLPTIADQVTINQGHTVTIPTGQTMQAGTLFNRGTLQNFGILQMGTLAGNVAGTLQTLDYKYHIRGGLKTINTDANNNLTNSLFSYKLDYEDDGTYFDGNIRKQTWKSNLDNTTRSYTYSYDGASRILQGSYTSTKANENYALNSVIYDANGNITNLSRNGFKSNNTFGLIDNLNYSYNVNSNKILKVDDASSDISSFKDVAGNDYDYWQDGSLKKDNNKEITQIDYNYLKLPEQITLTGGRWIKYDYDADGVKLKKTLSTGKVTDYEEDEIYDNAVLYQIGYGEGRIVNGIYEYNITDHLGNLRIVFKDSLGNPKILQSNAYGPWGEDLKTLKYANTTRPNTFTFNEKEVEDDFNLGLIDYKNRFHDAILGRFISVDKLSHQYSYKSPYDYAENKPISGVDLDGLEWVSAIDNQGHTKISLNISFNSLVPAQLLPTGTTMNDYKNAISNTFNSVLQNSSGGNFSGEVTFNGGDENQIGQVVPSLTIDANPVDPTSGLVIGGLTSFQYSSINLYNKNGTLKSPDAASETAVHELLHTLRIDHPFEKTQGADTKLTSDGNNNYLTTPTTDSKIQYNIMNYSVIKVNGVKLGDLWKNNKQKYLTADQLKLMLKEIQAQSQGQGMKGVNYLQYWLNFFGEDVEQK
jgi:RHS repeat-associated protein